MTTKKLILTNYRDGSYVDKYGGILGAYGGCLDNANNAVAIAILNLVYDGDIDIDLISKDNTDINGYDFYIGVGGEYSPNKGKYDYHLTDKLPRREYEIDYIPIKYMAAGAIWRDYGKDYLIKFGVLEGNLELIHREVDEKIIGKLDFSTYRNLNPSIVAGEYDIDSFNDLLKFVHESLNNAVESINGSIVEKDELDNLLSRNTHMDILVLDSPHLPYYFNGWERYLLEKGIKRVILKRDYRDINGTVPAWYIVSILPMNSVYSSRLKEYSNDQLDELIGVKGSLSMEFHSTKEGAIKLAELHENYMDRIPNPHPDSRPRPLRELPLDIIKELPDGIREETLAQYYEDHPDSIPAKTIIDSKKGKTSFWSFIINRFCK